MLSTHHHKIESIFIHIIAVFLLFSTISASFLGYGVYQSKRGISNVFTPVTSQAISYGFYSEWRQTSWGGGANPGAVTTVENLGLLYPDNWNKYDSASNIIIDPVYSSVKDNGSGNGQIVTTIFDLGIHRFGYWFGNPEDYVPSGTVFRVGNTLSEIQSAPWTSSCLTTLHYRYIQFKLTNLPINSWLQSFTFNSAFVDFEITIKDSTTNTLITNATISHTIDHGSVPPGPYTYTFNRPTLSWYENGVYSAFEDYLTEDTHTINISAPGYVSQTLTRTPEIPDSCIYFPENITVNLVPSPSTQPTSQNSSPVPSKTPTTNSVGVTTKTITPTLPQDTTPVSLADFQKTMLPTTFTESGATTTNLSQVVDHTKVSGFTLDIPSKSKVIFKDPLDLSTTSTVNALKQLDTYVKLDTLGAVQIDSAAVPALNKKATVYMYGLTFITLPDILVDGQKAGSDLVSNINYDAKTGTLSFDIAHFSKYQAVPKIELFLANKIGTSDTPVRGRVSDPKAAVSGWFNDVKLAEIKVDQKTGFFNIPKVVFGEGLNTLTLTAESSYGKNTLKKVVDYVPSSATASAQTNKSIKSPKTALIGVLIAAFGFTLLLGYLVYRRRKRNPVPNISLGNKIV